MKKTHLNRSVLAATSLTAIVLNQEVEAKLFTAEELSTLGGGNLLAVDASVEVLDFSKLTQDMIVNQLDLSGFTGARKIILPWFAAQLNIVLPESFGTPKDDSYGWLTFIGSGTEALDLTELLTSINGKVGVDTTALSSLKTLKAPNAVKIRTHKNTNQLHLSNNLEAIDRIRNEDEESVVREVIEEISLTVLPSKEEVRDLSEGAKPSFQGLAPSLIGLLGSDGSHQVDVSQFQVTGRELNLAGTNVNQAKVEPGETIGKLSVTGKSEVVTNALRIETLEFVSQDAVAEVVSSMSQKATLLAINERRARVNKYAGKTDMDFSKLDLGSVEKTAAAIQELLTGINETGSSVYVPIDTIQSMKIGAAVLSTVMSRMGFADLSGFSALKRLEIIGPQSGTYQATSLTKAQLPASLDEFYSASLVVRRGTLTANMSVDKKFAATELDLSELNLNGQSITVVNTFDASKVNTLRLNPTLLNQAAVGNLIASGSGKSIIVSGAAGGALNTEHLQNVETIDLYEVTGETLFSTPIDVDGSNANLSCLYLPYNFALTTPVLSGVDNGEVTVYISGAYADAIALDNSYNNTMLNFEMVTGNGRFQLPAGVRGLVLSNGVSGMNVGAAATANEFNLSGLTSLRYFSGLPSATTLLTLDNTAASSALSLNLAAATNLETLQLNTSRIAALHLPATNTLTNGGGNFHLNLSNITDLSAINGLNELLFQEVITQVSFPMDPDPTLSVNLVDTIEGIRFFHLDRIPVLTLDETYAPGENMWPTVIDKTISENWIKFFNYLTTPTSHGGINSPTKFDLSAQAITLQEDANAMVTALNGLTEAQKAALQTLIIRVDTANAINLGGINFDPTAVIIDRTIGSTGTITTPGSWAANVTEYVRLEDVDKANDTSWSKYLNYRFASLANKGQAATSLDLSSIELSAAEWTALMTALDAFDAAEIQTMHLKLVADDAYAAPAFTTADLSAATSIIIDVTGVKNAGAQVNVTGLPEGISEQRVTSTAAVDRSTAASWQGYVEHLLSSIDGVNYTLDLTAANLQLQTEAELAALNSALAALSDANKAKIQTIKLKVEAGNRGDFTFDSDLTGFDHLASFVVDATGVLNGAAQAEMMFGLQNSPVSLAYVAAHVSALASVDLDSQNSWNYYLAYRLATAGVELTHLDLSAVEFGSQADITAFLTSLHGQSAGNKATVQSVKIKLASDYADNSVNLGADVDGFGAEASGFSHGSFAVEVDRNGANATAPVSVVFGSTGADNPIRTANTTVRDTVYSGLGAFNGADAHQWLGYVRTVLSAVSDATITLDLSTHSVLAMNNAAVAAFVTAMNALPAVDKAKVAALKVKLASGNFGDASADFSPLVGFGALTDLIVDRNGARGAADVFAAPVSIAGPGTIAINDPEVRTFADATHTNNWLGYLRFVLNGMDGAANTVDLSSFAIGSDNAAAALNNALQALPTSEKVKVQTLKLNVTHAADITLGTGSSGFTALERIEYVKPATNSVTFAGALAGKRTYVTDLASVKMDEAGDWTAYLNYMLSADNGGQSATSLNLNSVEFANQDQLNAFFAGLNALDGNQKANKNVLTTLRMKLADELESMAIGQIDNEFAVAIGLNAALRVVVDPGNSTNTIAAGGGVGQVGNDNLIVLASDPAVSRNHIAYLVEQPGFAGTVDLSAFEINGQQWELYLNSYLISLPADMKAAIKTINLKLGDGDFGGGGSFVLQELTGFIGVTFNINRNGAKDTAGGPSTLVHSDIDNWGGATISTVNLTDDEFHDMSSFDKEDSAHWLGYLTHELNSAPNGFTLDLSVHSALVLDSADAVTALNEALKVVSNKTKVATLKVKSSVGGALGTTVTGFDNLTRIIVDYSAAGVAAMTAAFNSGAQTPYHYLSDLGVTPANIADWTRFFDYRLNAAADGGLGAVNVTVPGRLYASNDPQTDKMGEMLTGLFFAAEKASLQNLTFDLASTVVGDIEVGIGSLDALETVTINTNGSAAKLIPTFSFVGKTAFSSIANVKADSASSWLAYLTHALAGEAPITVDLTDNNLVLATAPQATALSTALGALDSSLKAKVETLKLKASFDATIGTDFGDGFSTIAAIELDKPAANAITISTPGSAALHIADVSKVNKSVAAEWGYYLNWLTKDAAAALDLSAVTLSAAELGALDSALSTFSTAADNVNDDKLSSISLKVSGTAGAASVAISADLTAQSAIEASNPIIVDVSGFVNAGTQATVTGTNVELQISGASDLYRNSSDSWGMYLNSLYAGGIPADTTLNLASDSNLYLRSQADVDALMSAINSRAADKANITTLNIRLAPGNVGSDIVIGNGTTGGWNPDMAITVTGSNNNGVLIEAMDIHYAGSVTSANKVITQNFLSAVTDATSDAQWTKYLNYLLSSTSEGGLGYNVLHIGYDNGAIPALLLSDADRLTAFMDGLNALDPAVKANLTHLYLDVSGLGADADTLGTGVSGFDNLQSVYYARLTAQDDATAAAGSSFENKIQRLRTAWNADTIVTADDMGEYLRYMLMDAVMGGAEQTVLDLVGEELNSTKAGDLNIALGALPAELKSRITELRLNLNAADPVNFNAAGLSNLSAVKYFQSGVGDITWQAGTAFDSATKTRFRSVLMDVDPAIQSEWAEYLAYQLAPAAEGGAGETTLDISTITLNSAQVTAFMAALNAVDASAITEISLAVSGYADGNLDLDGTGGTYNDNLKVMVYTDVAHTGSISLANMGASSVLHQYLFAPPEVTAGSLAWQRYLNYRLSTLANGGAEQTVVDLSGSREFASQAQLNAFFDGLDALDGASGLANKNVLQSLTLRLADGNFSAATARIGYTGSAEVTNLKADIAVTIQRNGARNGAEAESALVTVDHSDITTTGTKSTVDTSNAANPTRGSSASWLAYLTHTIGDAGFEDPEGNNSVLDLTAPAFQLEAASSATQAAALMNALQALDSSLKTKIDTIKIKLAAGDHGAGDLVISGILTAAAGFQAALKVYVDVAGAETNVVGVQKTLDLSGLSVEAVTGVKEAHVSALASVDLDNADSWGYYLNWLKADQGDIVSIDLDGIQFTTNTDIQAFFAALEARAGDKATVKDIFMEVNAGAVDFVIGDVDGTSTPVTGLTSLTSVVVQNTASNSIAAAGDVDGVEAPDLAVINSDGTGLGAGGTVAQWKGYLAYLLEDGDHGGVYAGSPVALDLTAAALQVADVTRLNNLEQAIAELPARLKARISAIVIKTTGTPDLTSPIFGDFAGFATDMSALRAIVIDCSSGATNLPTIQAIAGVSGIVY